MAKNVWGTIVVSTPIGDEALRASTPLADISLDVYPKAAYSNYACPWCCLDSPRISRLPKRPLLSEQLPLALETLNFGFIALSVLLKVTSVW